VAAGTWLGPTAGIVVPAGGAGVRTRAESFGPASTPAGTEATVTTASGTVGEATASRSVAETTGTTDIPAGIAATGIPPALGGISRSCSRSISIPTAGLRGILLLLLLLGSLGLQLFEEGRRLVQDVIGHPLAVLLQQRQARQHDQVDTATDLVVDQEPLTLYRQRELRLFFGVLLTIAANGGRDLCLHRRGGEWVRSELLHRHLAAHCAKGHAVVGHAVVSNPVDIDLRGGPAVITDACAFPGQGDALGAEALLLIDAGGGPTNRVEQQHRDQQRAE